MYMIWDIMANGVEIMGRIRGALIARPRFFIIHT